MKITIIGTHGSGKTTLSYLIGAEAKKRGKNARVVNEVARNCPFPLNDNFSIDGAHWIITQQICKELSAKAAKTEFIICDRSSVDPIMYLNAGSHDQDKYSALSRYAKDWMKTYDMIIFVSPDIKDIAFDGVRSTSSIFQKKVHDEFLSYIEAANLDEYIMINSSQIFSNHLDTIMKEIFS